MCFGNGDGIMDEDNSNNNDQPSGGQKPTDDKEIEYREISEEELERILENHKKWLETENKNDGKQAIFLYDNLTKVHFDDANLNKAEFIRAKLKNINLKGAQLFRANFFQATLEEVSLDDTNLQESNFSEATLKNSYFNKAKCHNANFYKANFINVAFDGIKGLSTAKLQYANFQGATGLLGNEFAQADVTGAKLPDGIKDFKALEIVKETSQNARKIFFAMILGCVYSWLTIATTTDVRLLTNTSSSPLPIIGTEIPIAWFYIAAPLVLIGLYFYFHLYLIKLWEALSGLPAIFPDGKRLDERAYPWLLNGLVRKYFKILKVDREDISFLQEWITIVLAWWIVPMTVVGFWFRYVYRHDWIGTTYHVVILVTSFLFATYFYQMCGAILSNIHRKKINIKLLFKKQKIFIFGYAFNLLFILAISSIFGFNCLGVDLGEQILSIKPENYWQIDDDYTQLKVVKGIYFRNANLDNADASLSFLVNADLRNVSLRYANLSGADLRKADLTGANLFRANLKNTNLNWVNFEDADLSETNLENSDFFVDHICKTKTMYNAKVDTIHSIEIENKCPIIFQKQNDK